MKRKKGVCAHSKIGSGFLCLLLFIWYVPQVEYHGRNQKQKKAENSDVSLQKLPEKINDVIFSTEPEKKIDQQLKIEPKKLTLDKLAQGFHSYAEHKRTKKGNDDLSITERRFLEKIVQCIQTSFLIDKQTVRSYLGTEYSIDIFIELNRNGFVKELIISKTSKNAPFDLAMKNMVEQASKAFPPIPQLIEKIPYRFVVRIDCQYGISVQLLLPR